MNSIMSSATTSTDEDVFVDPTVDPTATHGCVGSAAAADSSTGNEMLSSSSSVSPKWNKSSSNTGRQSIAQPQHLWVRSGFARGGSGSHRTALMHMIAARKTVRSQSSCSEPITPMASVDEMTAADGFFTHRSAGAASPSSTDRTNDKPSLTTQSSGTHCQRRRLVLKAFNRSWPSSSMSSSCPEVPDGGGGDQESNATTNVAAAEFSLSCATVAPPRSRTAIRR